MYIHAYITVMILATIDGVWIGFIEPIQLLTASKDYSVIVLHTSQFIVRHTRSSQFVAVFISRCLIAAIMADIPLFLGTITVSGLSYSRLIATAHNN
jgi:hypothetical protein